MSESRRNIELGNKQTEEILQWSHYPIYNLKSVS